MFHKYTSSDFYKTMDWYNLRRETLARDGGRCTYCGEKATTADHIVPRGRGGADDLINLTACCMICNGIAGGKRFESLDAKKDWVREKRASLIIRVKAKDTPSPNAKKRNPWPRKEKYKKKRKWSRGN